MKKLLSEKAINTIKDLLQTELLKRGILAPIKRIEEVEGIEKHVDAKSKLSRNEYMIRT